MRTHCYESRRQNNPWRAVYVLALSLLAAATALLIVVGLQKGLLIGVMAGLSALTLLSTGGLVYFSIRMVLRFERARDKEHLAHKPEILK